MNIFLVIFILIVLSKIISIALKKINIPPFLGMIILGILIGPTALNIMKDGNDLEVVKMFSKIGLFILIFIAGLETNTDNLRRTGKKSMLIAVGGIILPLLLGYAVTYYFTSDHVISVIMGLILTATSASITIMILMNVGKLVSVEGNTIANAALMDDIIGFLLLSILASIIETKDFKIENIIFFTSINIIYFLCVFLTATVLMDFIRKKLLFFRIEIICLAIAVFFFFIFSINAWKINLFTITGIYFAGLFISKTDYRDPVEETVKISQLIFVPFFFIFIGAGLDLKNINAGWIPGITCYIFAALTGKILGCGLVAKIFGFDYKRSFRIGCGMAPRGEAALIIASVTFYYNGNKFIRESDFISVIIMVASSIFIIQYLMMILFRDKSSIGVRHDIKID